MAIDIQNVSSISHAGQMQSVSFDIVDVVDGQASAGECSVFVKYKNRTETIVAYDGQLVPPFDNTSTRASIANGYRFTLIPFGGWQTDFTLIFDTGSAAAIEDAAEDWRFTFEAVTESEDYGFVVDAVTESENYEDLNP
jgi:hypothetical protein